MALTPVRKWIIDTLTIETGDVGTYWSDQQPGAAKFERLTGVTHKYLMQQWYGQQTPDLTKMGGNPSFTTCTGFLTLMNEKIRKAGGLQTKLLQTMKMDEYEKAAFVKATPTAKAKPGDFFLTNFTKNTVPTEHKNWVGMAHHVGIILEISPDDSRWARVAGGAGGRKAMKDGVSRSALELIPEGLVGWLDVDIYYSGWVKK
jgi:hypothetical protein